MADPWHHSVSSQKQWGGKPYDYIVLHAWFDESKAHFADNRHRAMRHHSEGIDQLIKTFGPTIKLSSGRLIPTRWVGEQHVKEDLGFIPTVADWLRCMKHEPWMSERARKLSKEVDTHEEAIDIAYNESLGG